MDSEDRTWIEVRVGITPDEAIAFLDALASDEELRERLERDPRAVLLEYNIDISPDEAPEQLQLPPPETIKYHADSLREREPFGEGMDLPHGFAVLYVAHGNGIIGPTPGPGPKAE
jgi:hypothetical protein